MKAQPQSGHERDQPLPVLKLWKVYLCAGVGFEEKGHDIRVEHDGLHAAGSVLARPRHARISARKSSMDSSSGQKLPSKSLDREGRSALRGDQLLRGGCPSREYF